MCKSFPPAVAIMLRIAMVMLRSRSSRHDSKNYIKNYLLEGGLDLNGKGQMK
jgi:hypothetical protein